MAIFNVTSTSQTGVGSITEAVLAAVGGDEIAIQVASIAISSEITITQSILTIRSALGGTKATFDGGNASRIFVIDRDSRLNLIDLKIINASSTNDGGAIRGLPRSTLVLDRCEFRNNICQTVDGAVFMANTCFLTARECLFYNNSCVTGVSEYLVATGNTGTGRGGGACGLLTGSFSYWHDCTFINNSGVAGGAINSLLSNLEIQDCIFTNNNSLAAGLNQPAGHANAAGGAVYTDGASDKNNDDFGVILILRSRFESNQSGANGAGVSAYGYRPITTSDPNKGDLIQIEDCLFKDNDCFALTDGTALSLGGGLRIGGYVPLATVRRCSFVNNTSENKGGGVAVSSQPSLVKFEDCNFSNNRIVENPSLPQDLVFVVGGGLISECPTDIRHCTFVGNHANQGSAIQITNSGTVDIRNSIVYNNPRVTDGSYIRQVRPNLGFIGSNNIQFPPDGWLMYTGVDSSDPLIQPLTSQGGVYYHPLGVGSPALDSGDSTYSNNTDLLSQTRGSLVDLGAVESDSAVLLYSVDSVNIQSDAVNFGFFIV